MGSHLTLHFLHLLVIYLSVSPNISKCPCVYCCHFFFKNVGRQNENVNKAVTDLNDSAFSKLSLPVDAMNGIQNTRCLLK